ncbi:MAG: hypothetical protein KDA25_11850 [Phycisphaerales bacterium]|nr:hypothetical protein [Phycisphaerales bacterium]
MTAVTLRDAACPAVPYLRSLRRASWLWLGASIFTSSLHAAIFWSPVIAAMILAASATGLAAAAAIGLFRCTRRARWLSLLACVLVATGGVQAVSITGSDSIDLTRLFAAQLTLVLAQMLTTGVLYRMSAGLGDPRLANRARQLASLAVVMTVLAFASFATWILMPIIIALASLGILGLTAAMSFLCAREAGCLLHGGSPLTPERE